MHDIIYRNIWSKNWAPYNIKNYINHKNTITVSITISQIHPCCSGAIDSSCRQSIVLNKVMTKEKYPSLILKRNKLKRIKSCIPKFLILQNNNHNHNNRLLLLLFQRQFINTWRMRCFYAFKQNLACPSPEEKNQVIVVPKQVLGLTPVFKTNNNNKQFCHLFKFFLY